MPVSITLSSQWLSQHQTRPLWIMTDLATGVLPPFGHAYTFVLLWLWACMGVKWSCASSHMNALFGFKKRRYSGWREEEGTKGLVFQAPLCSVEFTFRPAIEPTQNTMQSMSVMDGQSGHYWQFPDITRLKWWMLGNTILLRGVG